MSIANDDPARTPATGAALQVAVVEDDAALRDEILIPGLREYGFEVSGAESAAEFCRHMPGRKLHMVVLDIGLPDDSGLNVARHLRKTFPGLGIVMLTANRDRDDNIRAMTDGADVYLRKPVDVEVLAVTLHSLARRMAVYESQSVSEGGRWHLDANGWCLVAPARGMLALTAQERCVLTMLVEAQGQPVSRDALIAGLTSDATDFDPHRLDMLVHRLRRKAAAVSDHAQPFPLLSARGVGYRFAA